MTNRAILSIELICYKICYPDKNDAKITLREIHGRKQEHKKPIQDDGSLKCTCCHLT